MLAGLLAAGCAQQPAGQQAAVESCTRFATSALRHHVTVTSVPAACHGLTRAQLNLAAVTALGAIASTVHGAVRLRGRAQELRPLLAHPVATFPAQASAPPVSAPAGRPASGPPLALVALAAWLITVGLGCVMMARWFIQGGLRRAGGSSARLPPAMNVAHFGLAVTGLLVWSSYLLTRLTYLAWTACVLLLPVAGLGMALVGHWFSERSLAAATVPAGPAVPMAAGTAPAQGSPDPPAAWHPPALIVAAHVAVAMTTILFSVLAAIGSG
jgi:hypothetical protein